MSNLRSYTEYIDSEVEWLGGVPRNWEIRTLKSLAKLVTKKAEDRTFPVALDHVESWTGRIREVDQPHLEGNGVEFLPGDVLFGKLRPYLAKAWVADRAGEAVGDFHVIRPGRELSPDFLRYLMLTPTFISLVDGSTYGAKMPRASWEFIKNILWTLPPCDEQHHIAKYLDNELSKIDAFVFDQEKLISLLRERRTAAITHAVTKGLNPEATLVESHVKWMGKIPSTWATRPFLSTMEGRVDYRGATPKKVDSGIPLVTAKNVKQGFIDYSASEEFVAEEDYIAIMNRGTPRLNDLLLTMEAPLGNVALVDNQYIALAQRIIKFRTQSDVLPKFMMYAMNSQYFQAQLLSRATGSTALGLKASKLHELRVALPPFREQCSVVEHLDREAQAIDEAIDDAQGAIALSKERRAALISAAVTGKIDVRD